MSTNVTELRQFLESQTDDWPAIIEKGVIKGSWIVETIITIPPSLYGGDVEKHPTLIVCQTYNDFSRIFVLQEKLPERSTYTCTEDLKSVLKLLSDKVQDLADSIAWTKPSKNMDKLLGIV